MQNKTKRRRGRRKRIVKQPRELRRRQRKPGNPRRNAGVEAVRRWLRLSTTRKKKRRSRRGIKRLRERRSPELWKSRKRRRRRKEKISRRIKRLLDRFSLRPWRSRSQKRRSRRRTRSPLVRLFKRLRRELSRVRTMRRKNEGAAAISLLCLLLFPSLNRRRSLCSLKAKPRRNLERW
jgi:hypothetical protein